MRTTITLDDDVAAAVDELRRSHNRSLREVINTLLRIGLSRIDARETPRHEFRTRAVSLGDCRVPDVDDIADVLAMAEGEARR